MPDIGPQGAEMQAAEPVGKDPQMSAFSPSLGSWLAFAELKPKWHVTGKTLDLERTAYACISENNYLCFSRALTICSGNISYKREIFEFSFFGFVK